MEKCWMKVNYVLQIKFSMVSWTLILMMSVVQSSLVSLNVAGKTTPRSTHTETVGVQERWQVKCWVLLTFSGSGDLVLSSAFKVDTGLHAQCTPASSDLGAILLSECQCIWGYLWYNLCIPFWDIPGSSGLVEELHEDLAWHTRTVHGLHSLANTTESRFMVSMLT